MPITALIMIETSPSLPSRLLHILVRPGRSRPSLTRLVSGYIWAAGSRFTCSKAYTLFLLFCTRKEIGKCVHSTQCALCILPPKWFARAGMLCATGEGIQIHSWERWQWRNKPQTLPQPQQRAGVTPPHTPTPHTPNTLPRLLLHCHAHVARLLHVHVLWLPWLHVSVSCNTVALMQNACRLFLLLAAG